MAALSTSSLSKADPLAGVHVTDWNFANASSGRIHNVHPYPARFIPQIPARLIELLPPPRGKPVFDPFCGAGTTLLAAVERGLPAVGVDLNPIATLISRVKTTPLAAPLTARAEELIAAARNTAASIPALPRIDHWFAADVQEALAALVGQIDREPQVPETDALKLALSRIVVRVSYQDGDTRYAAVEKNVSSEQVYGLFLEAARAIELALVETYGGLFPPNSDCRVIEADVLGLAPEDIGPVGLVVTSPPYPNAYEYWLYHKYRMYWLGHDPIAVREAEIGARPHYFKKNHQTEHDFERQMRDCFGLLAEVMERRSYACFVVGNSIIHGRLIDNAELLRRAAGARGFSHVTTVKRAVRSERKSFNLAHARLKEESIVIFRLEVRRR
jgi:site-specific DNA-methyltransferase (cytosine-N4-specific)